MQKGVWLIMISLVAATLLIQETELPTRYLQFANEGGKNLELNIHRGKKYSNAPLIIWIHGGGWKSGTKEQMQPALAFQKLHPEYSIASIDYRLSSLAPFPAQLNDCKKAVAWLRENAKKYGLDDKKFVVWGSSAGGHLAALVGAANEYDGIDQATNQKTNVSAVIDYYGPTDLVALAQTPGFEGHAQPSSPESELLGGPVLERLDLAKSANPITYVSKGDPPFYVVHGKADRIVSPKQSELLVEALKSAQVEFQSEFIEGAGHGGKEFVEEALLKRIGTWLEKVLQK